MRGAQITVRCDCGEIGYAAYGERWVCRKCRRSWNTAQIPEDEYWGIMRGMRRLRLNVMAVALCLVVPIAALAPFLGVRILMLLPLVMGFWFIFYMPRWRRQVREQARSLRKWKLRPE
jgi:Flp pilus assembly protein TadB